jgi:hypothetical protein
MEINQISPDGLATVLNPPPVHIGCRDSTLRRDLLQYIFTLDHLPNPIKNVLVKKIISYLDTSLVEIPQQPISMGFGLESLPIPPNVDQTIVSALNELADQQHVTMGNSLNELVEQPQEIEEPTYSMQSSLQ